MLYKGSKAINQEINSAHWASLLFIVAQGSTSIYLRTFYSPKQKRKYILWPFKMSKKKKYTWTKLFSIREAFPELNLERSFSCGFSFRDLGGAAGRILPTTGLQTWEHSPCKAGARSTQLSAAAGAGIPGLCVPSQCSTLPVSWRCFCYNLLMSFLLE